MKKSKLFLIIFLVPLIIAFIVCGVYFAGGILPSEKASTKEAVATNVSAGTDSLQIEPIPIEESSSEESESSPEPEPEPVFEEYDIRLMMIGDNLFHSGVINAGVQDDGTRNYDFEFDGIKDFLELADIKIINQETPFGGNDKPFSTYPKFNTPEEVGDAIANCGFNVMLAATNHAGDMGEEGLYHFYHYMHDNFTEVLTAGIHGEDTSGTLPNTVTGKEGVIIVSDTEEPDLQPVELEDGMSEETPTKIIVIDPSKDYSRINLLNIRGFTFAFLNYTYGNNHATFFEWQDRRLDFLCTMEPDTRKIILTELNPQVLEDIRLARTIADVVVVCPHWGVEYRTSPTVYQQKWAKEMTEAGADVIIGTHPHVPEPVEWVTSDNGNEALCYYSLGNYTSTQNKNVDVLLEGMAWVCFHVTEDGISITKDECGILPLVNHYTYGPLRYQRTYLLEEYTPELAAKHGVLKHVTSGGGGFSLKYEELVDHANQIFKDKILTRDQILGQKEPENSPAEEDSSVEENSGSDT